MKSREELLKLRQNQCLWKQNEYCPITEFDKCKVCKAIHVKPMELEALVAGGWEGIKAKQRGEK